MQRYHGDLRAEEEITNFVADKLLKLDHIRDVTPNSVKSFLKRVPPHKARPPVTDAIWPLWTGLDDGAAGVEFLVCNVVFFLGAGGAAEHCPCNRWLCWRSPRVEGTRR